MIGVVVVAGQDSDRFRQRTQPSLQLHGIVVPQLVPGAFVQGRKTESGVRRTHRLAEPLQPLVGPHDVAHTVEREVPESLLEEILRPHLSGQEMRSGNVGYVREARLEILRDGDDAPLREQLHIVRIVKLSDHGVGAHPAGPARARRRCRTCRGSTAAAGRGSTPARHCGHNGRSRAADCARRLPRSRSERGYVPFRNIFPG